MTASDDIFEDAWNDLAASTWRRAYLGRNRCLRLVKLVIKNMPLTARTLSKEGRATIKRRVRDQYAEQCSSIFVTFILSWAIGRIVDLLIDRWWNQEPKA